MPIYGVVCLIEVSVLRELTVYKHTMTHELCVPIKLEIAPALHSNILFDIFLVAHMQIA